MISDSTIGEAFSYILGWAYFLAWSVSFYPQMLLNWKRRTVQGLSIDFLYYNIYGFLCYALFNIAFFWSEEIQRQYRERNDGKDNLVRINDVFFAVHAFCLSVIVVFQSFIFKRDPTQRASRTTRYLITVTFLGGIWTIFGASAGIYQWIDVVYYLSYVKLAVSVIKYVPQLYLNFKRKSTIGWSIHNILLDFTGGILSIAQLLLDAHLKDDWGGVLGDPVKLGLGLTAIAFDIVFLMQHYILYRNRVEFPFLGDEENPVDIDEEEHRELVTQR